MNCRSHKRRNRRNIQIFEVNRRDRRKKLGENYEEMSTDIRARLKKITPQCENIEEKPTN
jgi:hypothetical protein